MAGLRKLQRGFGTQAVQIRQLSGFQARIGRSLRSEDRFRGWKVRLKMVVLVVLLMPTLPSLDLLGDRLMIGGHCYSEVSQHAADLSTSAALELYAFYKQATCGLMPGK